MLSDEDLRRIAAEEHFRHGVRKSIEGEATESPPAPPPSNGIGKRLFEFLNSSLGMWLLSSVVLTGGAAMLQQIQHNHEVAQKNRQDVISHRFEIEHRLDNMVFLLRRAKTVGEAKGALGGIFKSSIPLTPELQNRSLASLYLAVYPLLAGSEKQKTTKAYNLVKQLEEVELLLQPEPDDKPLDASQRNHITKLITSIQQLHFSEGDT